MPRAGIKESHIFAQRLFRAPAVRDSRKPKSSAYLSEATTNAMEDLPIDADTQQQQYRRSAEKRAYLWICKLVMGLYSLPKKQGQGATHNKYSNIFSSCTIHLLKFQAIRYAPKRLFISKALSAVSRRAFLKRDFPRFRHGCLYLQ